ncbi:MAG TPA: hypothetical protein VHY37_11350 [Tepidisphaeraceae bacterium]|jgi:hypothetical protein|nr:hypothetical protein [Tepidisphaeraceae bacterium]
MVDPIEMPLDDDDPLAEPPLVDSLHYEREADGFSITFVPSNSVDATQTVFVPRDSPEGAQVSAYLYRIQQLIGNRIERVVHSGGGNYSLKLASGDVLRLSDGVPDEQWAQEVFDRLKQIADVAEIAFRIVHAEKA